MRKRPLGRTGLEVSEIGFGAWAIGGGYRIGDVGIGYHGADDTESKAALRRAVELGVNFIDTADAYGAGHSEELIGEVMSELGWDGTYICTKVGNQRRDPLPPVKNFSPDYIRRACEASLKRLRKDVIDVYLLHGPTPECLDDDAVYAALEDLRSRGWIRYWGASIHTPEEGRRLVEERGAQVLQVLYNILDRQAEQELFPMALERGVGIICRVPLSSGLLTGKFTVRTTFPPDDHRSNWLVGEKLRIGVERVERLRPLAEQRGITLAQLALLFCLAQPAVSTVIVGCKNEAQVQENLAVAHLPPLDAETLEKIRELVPGDFGNPT